MYQIRYNGSDITSQSHPDFAMIGGVLDQQVNAADMLEFTLPPTHPSIDILTGRTGVVEVVQDGRVMFKGDVISSERNFRNEVKFECQGALLWLNDVVIPKPQFDGDVDEFWTWLLGKYNAECAANRQITAGSCDITGTISIDIQDDFVTVLDLVREAIAVKGGYVFLSYGVDGALSVEYLASKGRTSSQYIAFGQNLLDLSDFVSEEGVFTRIYPVGKDGLDITSVNSGVPYLENSQTTAIYGEIGAIAQFDTESASELKSLGQAVLDSSVLSQSTLTLTAFDLSVRGTEYDTVEVGDMVRVMSEPHGIDTTMTAVEKKINLVNVAQSRLTLGKQLDKITSLVANGRTIQISAGGGGSITAETDPIFSVSPAAGITDADIQSWDNKSDFSGSYDDLTDTPTIPTQLSQLSEDTTHRVVTDEQISAWNASAASGAVKYNSDQQLTDEQKQTARTNIGMRGFQTYYGTSSTAAGTATKAVTLSHPISGYNYVDGVAGMRLSVKFTNAHTNGQPYLRLTGVPTSQTIYQRPVVSANSSVPLTWSAGETVDFIYDGANWIMFREQPQADIPTDILRYSAQTLTAAQKAQARENIGAGSNIAEIFKVRILRTVVGSHFEYALNGVTFTDIDLAWLAGQTIVGILEASGINGETYLRLTEREYYNGHYIYNFEEAFIYQSNVPELDRVILSVWYDGSIVEHREEIDLNGTGIDVDASLSSTSTNPVQNKAIYTALGNKLNSSDIASWAKQSSKPSYTKSEVGLGNVANVLQYSANNPPPDATTSRKGIVQLYAGTDSTSTTTAATASAVKAAYDRANAVNERVNTAFTNIDSVRTLATNAYDLADEKYEKPPTGIPATDMTQAVQTALGYADSVMTVTFSLNGSTYRADKSFSTVLAALNGGHKDVRGVGGALTGNSELRVVQYSSSKIVFGLTVYDKDSQGTLGQFVTEIYALYSDESVQQYTYVIPYNPVTKTTAMTQDVGVDANGKLWTTPSGGGSLPVTTNLLKGNGAGGAVAATPGTDYLDEAVFLVEITEHRETTPWSYTADKSFTEIQTAISQGKVIYAHYSSDLIPLWQRYEGMPGIYFAQFFTDEGLLFYRRISIFNDDSVEVYTNEFPVPWALNQLESDSDHRTVTDTQISSWGGMLPKSGGTVTGQIKSTFASPEAFYVEHSTANKDAGFRAKRADTGVNCMFGVGTGGINHGIYSSTLGKWLIYGDSSDIQCNCTSAGESNIGITGSNGTAVTNNKSCYFPITKEVLIQATFEVKHAQSAYTYLEIGSFSDHKPSAMVAAAAASNSNISGTGKGFTNYNCVITDAGKILILCDKTFAATDDRFVRINARYRV